MTLCPGDRVDRYFLRERIGLGGQAEVWRVEDSLTPGSSSALKLLHQRRVAAAEVERLRREARKLAELSHPSVVGCLGLFEDDLHTRIGVVMELVEGKTLASALGDPRLDQRAKYFVLLHVASALAHVHTHGIVHRDVKLENVLLTEAFFRTPHDPSTVKLIDFGIAVRTTNPKPLTRAGYVVGTTPYMAPELLDPRHFGGPRDAASGDVFAFGILAWRLLSGNPEVHPTRLSNEANVNELVVAYRQVEQSGWPARLPDRSYAELFKKTLALRPRDRIPNGAVLVRALGRLLTLDEPARESGTLAIEPRTLSYLPEPPTLVQVRRRSQLPLALALVCSLSAIVGLAAIVGAVTFLQPEEESIPPLPAYVGRGPL
jgi:serine/threonine-protein kinase